MLSVVIPTLDEPETLARTLTLLKEQAPEAELVVSDGGSGGLTLSAARAAAHVLVRCRRKGRAFQMDEGLKASSGKVVVFLHADTRLPDGWPAMLLQAFSSLPSPAAVSFSLRFDSAQPVFRWLERGAAWRQRLTGVPHGDQGIAVLRTAYLACGGFPDVPLMEEYELARRIRPQGRLVCLPQQAITSPRRYQTSGAIKGALRNNALIALWHLGVPPARLTRWYR
ncbi:MAG: TIGR04283 family arsenosugar biosynthesis glycosyltransferase [Elusimicrobia bacterium]|nr:TIGR04283 family arsenosugar biosynthesis glycosyltransferase [Elusimicrobiota bacterium]